MAGSSVSNLLYNVIRLTSILYRAIFLKHNRPLFEIVHNDNMKPYFMLCYGHYQGKVFFYLISFQNDNEKEMPKVYLYWRQPHGH